MQGWENGHRSRLPAPSSFPRALPAVFDVATLVLIHQLELDTGDIITFVLGKVAWAHCPPKAEQGAGIALGFRQNEIMSEMQKCGEQGSVQEQESITKHQRFVVGQGLQDHTLWAV